MESVVLVIHLFLALAIIGLVLLQRSEGGGLGIGGGGMGPLATPQGTANLLTRATAICGACFFVTSLTLAILAGQHGQSKHGILEAQTPPPIQSTVPGAPQGSTSPGAPSPALNPITPAAPAPVKPAADNKPASLPPHDK